MSTAPAARIVQIIGRKSSHFTRVARMFAHELNVPFEFVPVYDLASTNPETFAGNPTLKVPTLRTEQGILLGTENICRKLAELAAASVSPNQPPTLHANLKIVWPADLRDDLLRNAQELVWHGMAAQVQLIVGLIFAKLPADSIFFARGRKGFEGALAWLDEHIEEVLSSLPKTRALSLLEVALYCLVEHLAFRQTVPVAPYSALLRFAGKFGQRPSAQQTPYAFDAPPT